MSSRFLRRPAVHPSPPDSAFHLSGSQAARYQIVVVASFTRTAHQPTPRPHSRRRDTTTPSREQLYHSLRLRRLLLHIHHDAHAARQSTMANTFHIIKMNPEAGRKEAFAASVTPAASNGARGSIEWNG